MHMMSKLGSIFILCLLSLSISCGDPKSPTSESIPDEPIEEMLPEYDWSSCIQWVHDATGESLSTYPDDQFTVPSSSTQTGLLLNLKERAWLEGSSAFVKKLSLEIY